MVSFFSDFKDRGCEMKRVTEIKMELAAWKEGELSRFITAYETDERSGVVSLVNKAKEKLKRYEEELLRIEKMQEIERELSEYEYICGVDEVGRGPLAGPVVSAAVILPKNIVIPYLNDSKKLSEEKREKLYHEIMASAVAVAIGRVDNQTIDEINILNATFLAMKKAVDGLSVVPDFVLVDGNKEIPKLSIPQRAIVKGDAKSVSIAAASIVAKVIRDRQMVEWGKEYPMYGFSKNKGYGSKEHYQGLSIFGLCPLHRKSFVHI